MPRLFDYVTSNGEEHREEAQTIVNEGGALIEGLDVSDIAGGDGPFDFDEMVAGAKAGMANPEGAPLFIAFASSMPESLRRSRTRRSQASSSWLLGRKPQAFITGIRKVVDQAGASNVAMIRGCSGRFPGTDLRRAERFRTLRRARLRDHAASARPDRRQRQR